MEYSDSAVLDRLSDQHTLDIKYLSILYRLRAEFISILKNMSTEEKRNCNISESIENIDSAFKSAVEFLLEPEETYDE